MLLQQRGLQLPLLLTVAIQPDDSLRGCCLRNENSGNDVLVSIKQQNRGKATEAVLVLIISFNVASSCCCMGVQALPEGICQGANNWNLTIAYTNSLGSGFIKACFYKDNF